MATQDWELARKVEVLRQHGINRKSEAHNTCPLRLDVENLGYKANMFDIQAALLINQLRRIETLHKRRAVLCEYYESRFRDSRRIQFPKDAANIKSACHLFAIWVSSAIRDDLVAQLFNRGIGVSVHFKAIHLMKYYRDTFGFRMGDFPIAEEISASTISLPLYPKLTDEEAEYVADEVIKGANSLYDSAPIPNCLNTK